MLQFRYRENMIKKRLSFPEHVKAFAIVDHQILQNYQYENKGKSLHENMGKNS